MLCVTQNRRFPVYSSRGFLMSILVVCLSSLCILGPAGPPTAETAPATDEAGFRFELTPYLWLSGLKGDVRIRRLGNEVDAEFKDLLDHLDLGGALMIEAGKGNWSGWFDGCYVRLEEDAERARVSIGAVVEASIIDGPLPTGLLRDRLWTCMLAFAATESMSSLSSSPWLPWTGTKAG